MLIDFLSAIARKYVNDVTFFYRYVTLILFPGTNFSSFIFHCAENWLLRVEAAKVVKLIADRRSIPLLINLLNDKENIKCK